MVVFGLKGVIVAYAGTLAGLSLAFAAGRLLPPNRLEALLGRLGIGLKLEGFDQAVSAAVTGTASRSGLRQKIATVLLRYRYLTLAILLNCPANAVIGGGGGLALFCGMSRDIRWMRFLPMIAIAVAPVPVLVLFGLLNVEPMLHHSGVLHDALTALKLFLP